MADWEMIKSFAEKRVIDDYADATSNIYACENAIKKLAEAILEIKDIINKEKEI
jgi:CRISPR/Cas system CMR-associated protein Cmr5 small subunit